MRSHALLYVTSLLAATATASFDGNVNYGSPSLRHASLGIDVALVERRSMKRGNVAHQPAELSFTHGVASGDPWPESVILWTRIAPSNESDKSEATVGGTAALYSHETEKYIKADPNPICVEWKVFKSKCANGTAAGNVVTSGKSYTTSDIDYTVKVSNQRRLCGIRKMLTDVCAGRGQGTEAPDQVFLPVQHLRLRQEEPHRPHQDCPKPRRRCLQAELCRLLLQQLS